MTLDGTNTWVLRPSPAGRRTSSTRGRSTTAHLAAVAEAGRRRARGAADPPPPRPLRGGRGRSPSGSAAACGRWTRRYRLGVEGLGERRRGRRRRLGDPRGRDPRPHRRLAVVPAARRGRRAHRRHRARARHDRGGAPRRAARRLPRLARPAARARRGPRGRRRSGPATGRCIADALPVLDHYIAHRHERLEQVREALRSLAAGAGVRRAGRRRRSWPARSSRSSTSTSTRSCGAPPSSRSAPSWPTCCG